MLFTAVAAGILFSIAASADEGGAKEKSLFVELEVQLRLSDSKLVPRTFLFVQGDYGKVSAECFGVISGSFGEVICGPAFELGPSISITPMAGLNSSEPAWTVAGMATATLNGSPLLLAFVEYSAGQVSHIVQVSRPLGPLRLTILSQRGDGEGLRVWVPLGQVTPYASLLFNTEGYLNTEGSAASALVGQLGATIRF